MKINKTLSFALGILVLSSFSASKLFAAARVPEDNSVKYEIVEENSNPTANQNSRSNLNQKVNGAYTGSKTIRVRYGDTLWSIARANRPYKTTTKQTMLAILDLNPKSFSISNVNALMKNTNLRLPSYNQAHKRTAGRADIEVAKQNQVWADMQGKSTKTTKSSSGFGSSFFKSSSNKNASVEQQLAEARKNEQALQNQIEKMEKIIKQKDLTIKRMKSKSGNADTGASSALFKSVEKYTPLSGEAMKANWPWFVAGGFLLFMLFLILRWKRKNVYAGKGGKGGMSRAQKKQAKLKEKQAAKQAKLSEKEAKKQAAKAAKDAKLAQKQAKKQANADAKTNNAKSEAKDFDALRAKAMQELEKDFNLPPSQDLAIDAVLDTKVSKKKVAPKSASKLDDAWEEDSFAELDDLELDFDFDDELDLDLSKKPKARADANALSESVVEQKNIVDEAQNLSQKTNTDFNNLELDNLNDFENLSTFDELELDLLDPNKLDSSELSTQQLQNLENQNLDFAPTDFALDEASTGAENSTNNEFVLSDADLAPLDDFDILEDEELSKIIAETEQEFSDANQAEQIASSREAEIQETATVDEDSVFEESFAELSDLEAEKSNLVMSASEADTKDLDFSELETADTDFENISIDEDFLSESEAEKLEQEFLQEASTAETDEQLDFDFLDKDESSAKNLDENSKQALSAIRVLQNKAKEIQEVLQNQAETPKEPMPFFELKDFNDLLHGVIANPQFIECDEATKSLFAKNGTTQAELGFDTDAFAALEDLGGFEALGDIYEFTYSMPMRESVLDEEQLTAWRNLRDEERQEERQTHKVDGLTLNSKKVEFDKFYDTPQLHRLEELLQTKEIKEFEDYFSSDDEFDQMVENVKEDFLLDLTDFSEVPEFKEIEELDLDGLNEAIDLAEEQVPDKEELENILKDADQLEYESFLTNSDDLDLLNEETEFKNPTEDTFLADLSDFADLSEEDFILENAGLQEAQTQQDLAKNLNNSEILEQNLQEHLDDLDNLEKLDDINLADADLNLDFSSLNELVETDKQTQLAQNEFNEELQDELDPELLAEVANFAQNSAKGSRDEEFDFVDPFTDESASNLNFDTKLNLAAAYIAIGDFSEAAEILKLVAQKGNSQQQAKALELGERENLHI